jgi:hypothetical protein
MTIMDAADYGRNKHYKLAKKAIKQMREHGDYLQIEFMEDKLEKMLAEIKPKGGFHW